MEIIGVCMNPTMSVIAVLVLWCVVMVALWVLEEIMSLSRTKEDEWCSKHQTWGGGLCIRCTLDNRNAEIERLKEKAEYWLLEFNTVHKDLAAMTKERDALKEERDSQRKAKKEISK